METKQEFNGTNLCLNITIYDMWVLPIFTSHCIVEAMHVHASDRHLTESGSAKLFVLGNGDTVVKEQGVLTNKEMRIIREFIKDNYQEMFLKWSEMSNNGFYRGEH